MILFKFIFIHFISKFLKIFFDIFSLFEFGIQYRGTLSFLAKNLCLFWKNFLPKERTCIQNYSIYKPKKLIFLKKVFSKKRSILFTK